MKIAMLTGAFVNAGDFLIEQRSKALLETVLKGCTVEMYPRNQEFEKNVEQLNSYDVIVFTGGPLYQQNIYPHRIPFVKDLNLIQKPIVIMGAGWKGIDNQDNTIYGNKYYEKQMKEFLIKVHSGKMPLGCRDWDTVSRLRKEGLTDVKMTGCPAWYDLNNIDKLDKIDYKEKCEKGITKIIVSDAAVLTNNHNMKKLIVFLRKEFPFAEIKVLFHKGFLEYHKDVTSEKFLKENKISIEDISGSVNGFQQYDDCDLHIGFRVHAHIYNLSRGNISVLLNEDARGMGVNNTLGLRNINLAPPKRWQKSEDKFLEDKLADYLFFLKETQYMQYEAAGKRIQTYYPVMQEFIRGLEVV